MKRYWTRITLGAFGIFVLGMLVVSAGRRGVDKVKQLATQHALNISPGVAPFLVDLRRLGTLTHVEMDPENNGEFPYLNLTVQLDPSFPEADLGNCTLLASDAESLPEKGLHCAEGVSRDSLVEMGMVTFEPTGETETIFIPASQAGRNSFFNRVSRPDGSDSNRGSFDLQANAAGAFMLIKDDKGRPVFQLNADSQGAYIQIRDSNGKEVVRFRADSQGVVGRVHSN